MGRMIAIGDIHGYLEPLQQLMAQLALSSSDHVCFWGITLIGGINQHK